MRLTEMYPVEFIYFSVLINHAVFNFTRKTEKVWTLEFIMGSIKEQTTFSIAETASFDEIIDKGTAVLGLGIKMEEVVDDDEEEETSEL
jgi:hypothetical protein